MTESSLTSDLKTLGLTEYQGKALLALMSIGVGTPRDVARESGIPYPSAYDSLRSLAQKGWVEFASTRPAVFRVREPSAMKEKVMENVGDLFKKLQARYENIRDESTKLELIYTLMGRENVRRKIIEMLASVKREVIVVIPSATLAGALQDDIFPHSLDALLSKKNLGIRLITDGSFGGSSRLDKIQVRTRDSVLAVDLLCDREKALIGLPDLSACGWVDSPVIASHFAQFLDLLWKDSKDAATH
ncbi:MAG: TrmB family transcriptional regulator [Nitrososphaerales archaeon]